jgi:hypothetical protein
MASLSSSNHVLMILANALHVREDFSGVQIIGDLKVKFLQHREQALH